MLAFCLELPLVATGVTALHVSSRPGHPMSGYTAEKTCEYTIICMQPWIYIDVMSVKILSVKFATIIGAQCQISGSPT
jgi:hypothetical protein